MRDVPEIFYARQEAPVGEVLHGEVPDAGAPGEEEAMKLTGKELRGIAFAAAMSGDKGWDALAEKLNGMMAGERLSGTATPDDIIEAFKLGQKMLVDYLEPSLTKLREVTGEADRARHHATCPYRHGGEICKC